MKKLVFLMFAIIGLTVAFGNKATAQAATKKKVAVIAQEVKEKKDLPGPEAGPRERKPVVIAMRTSTTLPDIMLTFG
jgi:hypothetical protein